METPARWSRAEFERSKVATCASVDAAGTAKPVLRLVLDLAFVNDTTVSKREAKSLGNQIANMYAMIRRCPEMAELVVLDYHGCLAPNAPTSTSCDRASESAASTEILDRVLTKCGAAKWRSAFIKFDSRSLSEYFASRCGAKDRVEQVRGQANADHGDGDGDGDTMSGNGPPITNEVVYLSPDAPSPLEEVAAGRHTYVFGGIVDRTKRKGMTLERATSSGCAPFVSSVKHLPLREWGNFPKDRSCVLNIDTAAAIVAEAHAFAQQAVHSEPPDLSKGWPRLWSQVFESKLPKRKQRPTREVTERTPLPTSMEALMKLPSAHIRQLNLRGRLLTLW